MRPLTAIFWVITCANVIAQTNVDSLSYQLKNAKPDADKVGLLIELADHFVYATPNKSIEFSEAAVALAQDMDSSRLLALGLNRLGAAHWSKGNLSQSLTYLNQSLEISNEINDVRLSARTMGYLGNVNSMAGDDIISVEYYQKALVQFKQLNNQNRVWAMFNNIGKSYLDNEQLDSAAKYLNLADKAFRVEFDRMRPIHLFNLGELAFKSGELDKADSLMQLCLEKAQGYSDNRAISRSYQTQAEILLRTENYPQALDLAQVAYQTAVITDVKELIQVCAKTLSTAYSKNGDHNLGYKYLEIAWKYQDSLQSNLIKNKLAVFKHQQDRLELTLLKQQNDLTESKAAARKNIILGLTVVIILSIVLMYILIRGRREINAQKVQLADLNNFKTRMFAIVAHDLRSPVGQLSNMIDVITANLVSPQDLSKVMPSLKEEVTHILGLMDNIFQWARSNMEGQSINKDSVDLYKLVDEMISKTHHLYAQKKITIVNNIDPHTWVNSDKHLLTIILRNLVINAIKFSYEDSDIKVFAVQNGGVVKLSVQDHGVGMTTEHVKRLFSYDAMHAVGTKGEIGTGLGLILCRDFVRKLGGTIWAQSELQKGSTFTFSFLG